ncbi:SH3 domain-containing protein [Herpetosiphon sp. NSE202]|uniref:SH3 domain-containing protein n=1 Tax=Herpetosiphon sp. NSE202 TaxID=3351349 RepID=UPI0036254069
MNTFLTVFGKVVEFVAFHLIRLWRSGTWGKLGIAFGMLMLVRPLFPAPAKPSSINATSTPITIIAATTIPERAIASMAESSGPDQTSASEKIPNNDLPAPEYALHTPFTIGQWNVTIEDITMKRGLSTSAKGEWLVVHGTIVNEGDSHAIGKQELSIRWPRGTRDLDRAVSKEVAKLYEVTNIGQLGGVSLDKGETVEWAVAFDVPSNMDTMWFRVNAIDTITIDTPALIAALPTATPRPTIMPRPTIKPAPTVIRTVEPTVVPTATPAPLIVQLPNTANLRNGPNQGYTVLAKITPSQDITILAQRSINGDMWYRVQVDNQAGWMSGSLFTIDETRRSALPEDKSTLLPMPTATPTPKPQPTARPASNSGQRVGAICRDGTRSNATGRGACSHHGGVDHWLYAP